MAATSRSLRDRLAAVKGEITRATHDEHTPRAIAGSFAIGTFIAMMPTLGTGLVLFVPLVYFVAWVSKIALLASVIIFNPVVKWGVYAGSFALGTAILGPVEGVTLAEVSLSAGPDIVLRLLVGNIILAMVAALGSYVLVKRFLDRYGEASVAEVLEETVDVVIEAETGAEDE